MDTSAALVDMSESADSDSESLIDVSAPIIDTLEEVLTNTIDEGITGILSLSKIRNKFGTYFGMMNRQAIATDLPMLDVLKQQADNSLEDIQGLIDELITADDSQFREALQRKLDELTATSESSTYALRKRELQIGKM